MNKHIKTKLRVGDTVKVTRGKDKGRDGKIEKISKEDGSVIIDGVNIYKKHVKGSQVREGQKGGIYSLPRPLPPSAIALICPKCKKVTRIGIRIVGEEKVRVCRKCRKEIDTK
jgi:large subunit ribosomal protein L24